MASNKTTGPSKNSAVEVALRERIKELECLYGISKIAVEQRDLQLDGIINNILKLLPPAWQYPDITVARIVIDENSYTTSDFKLIYLNSGSKRYILDLLEIIKSSPDTSVGAGGKNVTINWYYEEDDDDMLEMGKSYGELVDLPINFIPVKVD